MQMEAIVESGSPAYAGIDRQDSRRPMAHIGFPRLRGDRPDVVYQHIDPAMVPPPTRG